MALQMGSFLSRSGVVAETVGPLQGAWARRKTEVRVGLLNISGVAKRPCYETMLFLEISGFLKSITVGTDKIVEELEPLIQAEWGHMLRTKGFNFFLAKGFGGVHENLTRLENDHVLANLHPLDVIFVQPMQLVPEHQRLLMHCSVCSGASSKLVRENGREPKRTATEVGCETRLCAEWTSGLHDHHSWALSVPNVQVVVYNLLKSEHTEWEFWNAFQMEVMDKAADWTVVRLHRDVHLQTLLNMMTHCCVHVAKFRITSPITFEFLNEAGTGTEVHIEAWTYLAGRVQSEDLIPEKYRLLTGRDGRKRFKKAAGVEWILFRQAAVFVLKSFLHGGAGFVGLHTAVQGYLLGEYNWMKHLIDFEPADCEDPNAGEMMKQLLSMHGEFYIRENYCIDFKTCYGSEPRGITIEEAIREIAYQELLVQSLQQLNLIRSAIEHLGLRAMKCHFSQARHRLFKARMFPSRKAVEAMFRFKQGFDRDSTGRKVAAADVIFNALRAIGNDPMKLRRVVLATTGTYDPHPNSVTVAIRRPEPHEEKRQPVEISTCLATVTMNPGYTREQWIEWIMAAFSGAGYTDFKYKLHELSFAGLGVPRPEQLRKKEIICDATCQTPRGD